MSASWTATAQVTQAFGWSSPATFSSVAIGTASSDRIVVVLLVSPTRNVASITVAGTSATVVAQTRSGNSELSIWQAAVASGTTADIVVTATDYTFNDIIIFVGSLSGASETAYDTTVIAYGYSADPHPVDLDIPSDGIGLYCYGSPEAALTFTADKGTPDANTLNGATQGSERVWSYGTSGTQTLSISGANWSGGGAVAASWSASTSSSTYYYPVLGETPALFGSVIS
jgi:hypothetical protein